MRKICHAGLIAVILVLSISCLSYAVPWKNVKSGAYFPLFGQPIQVESVQTTRETCKDGKCYYSHKLIIRRPSRDDGWGRASYKGFRARLHYWSATLGFNPYLTLASDKRVFQNIHQDPRKIVVHIMQGLPPGKAPPQRGNYSLSHDRQLQPEKRDPRSTGGPM